ncbi:nuclear transport factor 2 family protein [Pseudomonas sp. SWRI92]|uniref:Nuclear transport factor 2 family protein n=1 Tax=Pseudomonas marvdashtae TaxID=2745500 RepID=A0A923FTE1_9PSED|nr:MULTISPECIES: nuclear transport factor 2 family protein [Pseudomonas]MBC3375610.1 nuclear transport factor 2 family protein [Pseudomonas sp. SWRI92]MBV4554747.1 nuclear transport factor 2 family protein [Pseudomonas marvdashtae]
MDNLSLIKSTYEGADSQENARNTAAALAEDARWTEAAGFPYAGTYVGFDAVLENVFKRLATEWDGFQFQVEDYVAQGDKVFAYGTYSGVYKATGLSMKARVAHLWTLADGKVTHFEQFVDSHTVQQALQNT